MEPNNFNNLNLKPIREEFDLGDRKRKFRGKTIKIKKLVKKETGSFTLKDTLLHGDDSVNTSVSDLQNITEGLRDPNIMVELKKEIQNMEANEQNSKVTSSNSQNLSSKNIVMTKKMTYSSTTNNSHTSLPTTTK